MAWNYCKRHPKNNHHWASITHKTRRQNIPSPVPDPQVSHWKAFHTGPPYHKSSSNTSSRPTYVTPCSVNVSRFQSCPTYTTRSLQLTFHHWQNWFNNITLPALEQYLPILKPIDKFTYTTKITNDHTPYIYHESDKIYTKLTGWRKAKTQTESQYFWLSVYQTNFWNSLKFTNWRTNSTTWLHTWQAATTLAQQTGYAKK